MIMHRMNQVFVRATARMQAIAAARVGVPALALVIASLTGCGFSTVRTTSVSDLVAQSAKIDADGFTAQIGDVLTIRFYFDPELDFDALVRPDGSISLSLVGDIPAAGRKFPDLSKTITDAYKTYLNQPNATVLLRTPAGHRAFVTGEVNFPTVFTLQGNETALSVISNAGGLTDRASLKKVILIRHIPGQPEPLVARLNLKSALTGEDPRQDVKIYLGDILYVPRTGAAETNVALRNAIWGKGPVGITAGAIWNGTIH